MADVYRVTVCEESPGGWFYSGGAYPNSIGMTAANWARFGFGGCVSDVCQTQAELSFDAAYGIAMPDQNGCSGSY